MFMKKKFILGVVVKLSAAMASGQLVSLDYGLVPERVYQLPEERVDVPEVPAIPHINIPNLPMLGQIPLSVEDNLWAPA
jgi:hypothetical protein